jgi:hypothetical protein
MDTLVVENSEAAGLDTALFTNSSLREKILEHQFVGELLRVLWCRGMQQVELLKAEVDAGGYDLVLECNGVMRHVQLKSSYRGAKTSRVNINVGLQRRDSGCVIWIMFDPVSLHIGPFLWLGNPPDQPTPGFGDRIGRHSKGDQHGHKAERPNIRVVSRTDFTELKSMGELADALFGPPKPAVAGAEAPSRCEVAQ